MQDKAEGKQEGEVSLDLAIVQEEAVLDFQTQADLLSWFDNDELFLQKTQAFPLIAPTKRVLQSKGNCKWIAQHRRSPSCSYEAIAIN